MASPDVGGVKRAQIFRELLERRLGREIAFAFIEKRRAGHVVSSGRVVGEVADRVVVVLDDLCTSGGTLIRAAIVLHGCRRACGASRFHTRAVRLGTCGFGGRSSSGADRAH